MWEYKHHVFIGKTCDALKELTEFCNSCVGWEIFNIINPEYPVYILHMKRLYEPQPIDLGVEI